MLGAILLMQALEGISRVNDASPLIKGKALAQGPGALFGLKVIDLTRVLGGPYCTMVLSDHGADVIKLEPPQGDETRECGPPFDDAGDASYFIGKCRLQILHIRGRAS